MEIEQYNKMIELLMQKNLNLVENIGKCRYEILLQEAQVIKVALENAQALKNI